MVYLATSKLSVVVLGNLVFALTLVLGNLLKKVFLGTLREAEVERLQERSKEAMMETCLAMTIFREEFNTRFVALFVMLLLVKMGHWLSHDRVAYVETTPALSYRAHVRILTFLVLLLLLDAAALQYAVGVTLSKGPSVLLYFGFEYVILASATVSTIVKYGLYMGDMMMDGRWDNKGLYVFYLELVTDLLHIFVYLVFFLIIMKYYGFPLHLMRDLYATIRNFRTRVADFIRYRRVTTNMNERFPDATAEELGAPGEAVCIICREEMDHAKRLGCGHLFHASCLRSWLERQQTCPTCRAPVDNLDPPAATNVDAGPDDPRPNDNNINNINNINADAPATGGADTAPADAASGASTRANSAAPGPSGTQAGPSHASGSGATSVPSQAHTPLDGQQAMAQWYAAAPNWYTPFAGLPPAAVNAPTASHATVGSGSSHPASAPAPPGWMGYGGVFPYMHPSMVAPSMYMLPPPLAPHVAPASPTGGPSAEQQQQHHHMAAAAAAAATAAISAIFPLSSMLYLRPPSPASGGPEAEQLLQAMQVLNAQLPSLLVPHLNPATGAQPSQHSVVAAEGASHPSSSQNNPASTSHVPRTPAGSDSVALRDSAAPTASGVLPTPNQEAQVVEGAAENDSPASELRRRRLEHFANSQTELELDAHQ